MEAFFSADQLDQLELDGFGLSHLLPGIDDRGIASARKFENEANLTTWQLLILNLKHGILLAIYMFLRYWALHNGILSNIIDQLIWKFTNMKQTPEHYRLKKNSSLLELQELSSNRHEETSSNPRGPRHVLVTLGISEPVNLPVCKELPKSYQLASGEIIEPTVEEVNEYKRLKESRLEALTAHVEREISALQSQLCRLILWANATKSIEKLTIYEPSGLLARFKRKLRTDVHETLNCAPTKLLRPTNIRYAFDDLEVAQPSGEGLEVVICSDRNHGSDKLVLPKLATENLACELLDSSTLPDLFITADGTTGGVPAVLLLDSVIFAPLRRGLMVDHCLELEDFIGAIKMYNDVHPVDPHHGPTV